MLASCSETPSLWTVRNQFLLFTSIFPAPRSPLRPAFMVLGYNSPNGWRQSFPVFCQEGSLTYILLIRNQRPREVA